MNDLYDGDNRSRSRKRNRATTWGLRVAAGAALLGFVGLLAAGAWSLLGQKETTKRQVVQISLLKPPPPPPPPPPPEVKPPEPQVKPEEVKLPEPDPQPKAEEAPPPGEQLGLDADANGAGDGFGLAARKGGQDITTLGGGGGNRAQLAWFTGMVEGLLQEQFQKHDKLRRADYRAVVKVWFTRNGAVERFELAGSTGNPEIDRNLQVALSEMPRLRQPPPDDLPQPVKVRITSRGSG